MKINDKTVSFSQNHYKKIIQTKNANLCKNNVVFLLVIHFLVLGKLDFCLFIFFYDWMMQNQREKKLFWFVGNIKAQSCNMHV